MDKGFDKTVQMRGGYFDNEKKEYVITDMFPRKHLTNYLWNEEMVCTCDHFGNGNSWFSIATGRRTIEAGDRNVYIKDKTTGESYSANRNHAALKFDKFETHVGLGYHTVVSEYKGVAVEFTTMVPVEGCATLFEIKVKNLTQEKKDLALYFCIQPKPDLSWHAAYGYSEDCRALGGLLFHHDGFRLPNDYTKIFVGSDKEYVGYDTNTPNFKGKYNGWHNPVGVQAEKLRCEGSTFETEHAAAFQFDLALDAGEEYVNTFAAFAARSVEECRTLKDRYLAAGAFEKEKNKQKELNAEYADVFLLHSPDAYVNTQANIWLKRQLSLGKTWGRLYGKGFRDVMQDITAFVSFDPALARKRILHALAYQYEDGNPIRMFEPNFKYPYNDGGAWITGAILSYLNESGDLSVLDEVLPYLKGDSYEHASLSDAYSDEPYVAGERKDSVLGHACAAIDYLLGCRGEHDLVLWRGGDWNDSMNSVGLENKGESVWLSIATVKAIGELQEILALAGGKDELIAQYESKKEALKRAVKTHGFNGKQYIYGINDQGDRIGDTDRIFLNPQTWAVLGNLDEKENLEAVMDEVEARLQCDFGYLQCYPSFEKGDPNIGRVSYFQKGLVENGAVYNHGVAFKIAADCMLGRGDNAYRSLKMISCDNPKNPDSGVEPYAVSNMYIGPENPYLAGFAPMSWVTGTAGWLYRCISEFLCGVKPTVKGLKLEPCLPRGWSGTRVVRKFRGETYEITFEEAETQSVVCDGKEVDVLPLCGAGATHVVVCKYICR